MTLKLKERYCASVPPQTFADRLARHGVDAALVDLEHRVEADVTGLGEIDIIFWIHGVTRADMGHVGRIADWAVR